MEPAPAFVPHPLLRGSHAQTVLGSFGRAGFPIEAGRRHAIEVPGGDRIVLHDDTPPGWQDGAPVAVLQHGLTGSHASAYVVRIAGRLGRRGMRTIRVDARGWGAGAPLARGPAHAGRSEDLRAALRAAAALAPGSPLVVAGFSLGGNVLLKMLGEAPDDLPASLARAVAVNPSVDLEACSAALAEPSGRLYDRYFALCLHRHVARLRRLVPDLPAPRTARRLWTVRAIDDAVTAPWAGFADAADYYARASAGRVIGGIRVPTLVLAAQDDPVVPAASLVALTLPTAVQLLIAPAGGHMGYVSAGGNGDPDRRWMDHRVVDWLSAEVR